MSCETILFLTFINLKCTVHQTRKLTSDYSIEGTYLLVESTSKVNVCLMLQMYEDPTQKIKYLNCQLQHDVILKLILTQEQCICHK